MLQPIIIAIIGSGALTALITNIFNIYRDRKSHEDGIAEGVQLLLYDRIKYLCKGYISLGQIAPDDLEDLSRMWECYHNPDGLNGNGYLDSLMQAVRRLPIISGGTK